MKVTKRSDWGYQHGANHSNWDDHALHTYVDWTIQRIVFRLWLLTVLLIIAAVGGIIGEVLNGQYVFAIPLGLFVIGVFGCVGVLILFAGFRIEQRVIKIILFIFAALFLCIAIGSFQNIIGWDRVNFSFTQSPIITLKATAAPGAIQLSTATLLPDYPATLTEIAGQESNTTDSYPTETPNYPATISALQTIATKSASSQQPTFVPITSPTSDEPYWASEYVAVTPHDLYVCKASDIYSAPTFTGSTVGIITTGWSWRVYGYVNDWWFIGKDDKGNYNFVPKNTLCDSEPTGVSVSHTPVPTSKPAASKSNAPKVLADGCPPFTAQTTFDDFIQIEDCLGKHYDLLTDEGRGNASMEWYLVRQGYGGRTVGASMQTVELIPVATCAYAAQHPFDAYEKGFIGDQITECQQMYGDLRTPEFDAGVPCDSVQYKKWAYGKSDTFVPECTPTPHP